MVEEEIRRYLPKAKLSGCYNRLIGFIARFDDSVRCAHANWKEAGTDHDRIQLPSAIVIGKVVQPKTDWIFKIFRSCVREEKRVVQALEENLEPLGCLLGDQFTAWKAVQGLAIAGASDLLSSVIWKGAVGQRWKVWDVTLEI